MAKHKLFCVPGTWEAVAAADGNPGGITPGAEIGMLRGVTDLLNRDVFDVVYVNYPASFGPIPGGGEDLLEALGDHKYAVWDIIPGWTALRHSANHPNFWGPRLPTTLDV